MDSTDEKQDTFYATTELNHFYPNLVLAEGQQLYLGSWLIIAETLLVLFYIIPHRSFHIVSITVMCVFHPLHTKF